MQFDLHFAENTLSDVHLGQLQLAIALLQVNGDTSESNDSPKQMVVEAVIERSEAQTEHGIPPPHNSGPLRNGAPASRDLDGMFSADRSRESSASRDVMMNQLKHRNR